jgi:hypothetical protein
VRDDFAVAVDPAGEGVDLGFEDVADDGETAAHVAVERAVADGHFALVAGGEEERAEFVGESHHQHAADAGLDVLLGDVGARPAKMGPRAVSAAATASAMAMVSKRMPRLAASRRASSRECCEEIEEGRETPMTFSGPKASAAITATTAESMPPERAMRARLKPLLCA